MINSTIILSKERFETEKEKLVFLLLSTDWEGGGEIRLPRGGEV